MNIRAKVRLFVDAPLGAGQSILLDRDQANYLFNVMRLNVGAFVSLFNSKDGEWQAEVFEATKRKGIFGCENTVNEATKPTRFMVIICSN